MNQQTIDRRTVKPICVIYLPVDLDLGGSGRALTPIDLMRSLNDNFDDENSKVESNNYWKEYYWFCFNKPDIIEPEFQVFYEKDFTEIQFEELKELILKSINELK